MLERFKKYIAENNLINHGDRILLAVSGGIDSMVMTHLFLQAGYEVGIAHCNFSLRAAESDNDEKMVSEFAAEHSVRFFTTRFETKLCQGKWIISPDGGKGTEVHLVRRDKEGTWL
jgi:tRNA(Ile)-lysidine synthase